MDDKQRAKFDLDWAREMDGQFFGCAPCVPYDDDSTDVLHLCLNSFGSATLECFDRHLRREYPDDAELRALTEAVRDKVKERLKASGVLVEFWTEKGKDVNGPKLRRLLLDSAALYDFIMLMTQNPNKWPPYLRAISTKNEIISSTIAVTTKNSTDLSSGRRPMSKSVEFLVVTAMVVEK